MIGAILLYEFVGDDNIDEVKKLFQAGLSARVPVWQHLMKTPLHQAKSVEMVKLLIEHGADVNAKDEHGTTPIIDVAQWCRDDRVVAALLELGADPLLTNDADMAVLHHVVSEKSAKVLIDAGADVNARDDQRGTPLHYAVLQSRIQIVKLLIEHGADVNARDMWERTPLDLEDDDDVREAYKAIQREIEAKELNETLTDALNAIKASKPETKKKAPKDGM